LVALNFSGKSAYSVCGGVLGEGDDVVLHPHLLPAGHPLWRFSDSAMHRGCYEGWEHHRYFETVIRKHRDLLRARPALPTVQEMQNLPAEEQERRAR
jgi:hypothetical protein